MMRGPFTVEERDTARESILELARADSRVIASAVIGSEATGNADRWSDLDLTFGLAPGVAPDQILDEWTPELGRRFGAVHLFDVRRASSLYRVFLFPGALQVDLSATTGPVAQYGPAFRALFGEVAKFEQLPSRAPPEMFGYAVHHAVRARFCIERGRFLQAEYWVSGLRDEALALACQGHGLETSHGRGFDRLPSELRARASESLVRSLERPELLRALESSVQLLLQGADEVLTLRNKLIPQLRDLTSIEWIRTSRGMVD